MGRVGADAFGRRVVRDMREQGVGARVVVGPDAPTGPLFGGRRTPNRKGAVPPVRRIGASRRRPGRHPHPRADGSPPPLLPQPLGIPGSGKAGVDMVPRRVRVTADGSRRASALSRRRRSISTTVHGDASSEVSRAPSSQGVGGRGEADGCDHVGAQGRRYAFRAVATAPAPAGTASTSWRASRSWVPRIVRGTRSGTGGLCRTGGRTVEAAGSRRAAARQSAGKRPWRCCPSRSRTAGVRPVRRLRIRWLRPVFPAGTSARARRRVMSRVIGRQTVASAPVVRRSSSLAGRRRPSEQMPLLTRWRIASGVTR